VTGDRRNALALSVVDMVLVAIALHLAITSAAGVFGGGR
jgi:hypothetical protein